MKKILITGATGFIGSALIDHLIKEEAHITIIGRNPKKLEEINNKHKNIEHKLADLSVVSEIDFMFSEIYNEIYHLAGYKYVNESEKNVLESINSNLVGTINLLLTQKEKNNQVIIKLVSSDKTSQVKGVYSATKFLNDKLVSEFKKHIPNIYNLKLSNVFQSPGSIGDIWKNLIIKNESIGVSDLSSTRFFSTVQDVIKSLINPNLNLKIKSVEMKTLIEALIIKYNHNYERKKIRIIGLKDYENLHEYNERLKSFSNDYSRYTLEELILLL